MGGASSSRQVTPDDMKAKAVGLPVEDENGGEVFKVVSKEELYKQVDSVSIHYVLSERAVGIVGRLDLSLIKRTACFINISRGELVEEMALLDTLESGAIRGVAVDVFNIKPLRNNSR